MKEPKIIEKFSDNGEHSHYELIDVETGEIIWSEDDESEICKCGSKTFYCRGYRIQCTICNKIKIL